MTLLRRIVSEHRRYVIPLAIVLVANIAAYALVVYPLGVKSATARDRADAAAAALRAAEADQAAAQARVSGRARAEQELGTFYGKILPADLAAARRLTYVSIPQLAEKANVRYQGSHWEPDLTKSAGALGHIRIHVVLQGDYENLRRFIYNLETSPQFLIIDDVTLAQAEQDKPLTLTLELSTYYRLGGNGA